MKTSLSFLLLIIPLYTYSQDRQFEKLINNIKAENLKKYVDTLASPFMEGRGSGMEGEKKAAKYLLNFYHQLPGLKQNDYILNQQVPIHRDSLVYFTLNHNLKFFDDFMSYMWMDFIGMDSIDVSYAGYGINHPEYLDYKDINSKNKLVFVSEGEPPLKNGIFPVSGTKEKSSKLELRQMQEKIAQEHQAKALFYIIPESEIIWKKIPRMTINKQYRRISPDFESKLNNQLLTGAVTEAGFQRLFPEISTLPLDKNQLPIEKKIPIQLNYSRIKTTASNIILTIPGQIESAKAILCLAHYDHAGVYGNTYYPGADDNASGTSIIMELAKTFQKALRIGYKPDKSIIFANVACEEAGLLGSLFLSEHMPTPYDSLIIFILIWLADKIL